MKNPKYDLLTILGITAFLLITYQLGWLEKYYGFAFVPMYACYQIGKWAQRQTEKPKEMAKQVE